MSRTFPLNDGRPRARGRLALAALLGGGLLAADAALAQAVKFDVETFRPWAGYAIPNGEWVSADINGDGRTDVVHLVAGRDYAHTWTSKGDGTFAVGTFRPWAGYKMPNGRWMAADLDGDKRLDLVHVVAGKDYVHAWLSRGNGTFDVRTYRPWSGYAMPNGEWRVLDFDEDGRDDLVHLVSGRDYAHTWRSLGNGTFTVGTFRPWRGYAMPNGEWLTGDIDGDGRGDLVHAVKGRDYVHTWRSRGNGTFTVGTFRPWRGYAIPNGEWRMLDFNGDGRDDIVHVVAGRDYVHPWRSLGDGKFAVSTFRPWAGYAMPNGVWRVGDLNRDGRMDLIHAVAGRDYAHSWLSNGNGTFDVGTFRPWSGYAIPNGVWLEGDFDGDGKGDLFHAVRNRDVAHPWLSRFPARGEFFLEGLELTQAVQDMAHSVPMVAGKDTIVRAYPGFAGAGSRQVRGRLWVLNGGNWTALDALGAASVNAAENGNLRAKRERTDASLNFSVPAGALSAGGLRAWFERVTDAGTGATLACSGCRGTARNVTLGDDNTFRVRVLGMRYSNGSPAATFEPRALDYTMLRSWLRRAYPTGDLRYTSATVAANVAAPFGCSDVNARLTAIRNADVAAGRDRRTHYYGLVFDDSDSRSFFMRGCSAGIPGSASPGTVASGPTGSSTWGWDNDGSYGDWYGGHEIGHTVGRSHIGSGCGDSDSDSSYPFPNGQISGADGAFTGFDTGDAALGLPMRALPGTQWTDVMSYCPNQWISSYTYAAIRDRIAAEDGLGAGAEPSADIEIPVAGLPAGVEVAQGERTEIVEGVEAEVEAGAFGGAVLTEAEFVPQAAPVADPEPAMEEAPEVPEAALEGAPEIVDGQASDPLMAEMLAQAAGAPGEGGRPLPPEFGGDAAMVSVAPPEFGTADPAVTAQLGEADPDAPVVAETTLADGDFLAIAGTANLTEGTASFVDVRRAATALVPSGPVDSPVTVRALDASGTEIASTAIPFLPNSDREEGEDLMGVLDGAIPFPAGVATLELVVEGEVADSFSPPAGGDLGPSAEGDVAIEAARSDDPTEVPVSWEGGALEGAAGYDVQVSDDGGTTWSTLAVGLTEPETVLDLSGFEAGEVGVRVLLNAGFDTRVVGETVVPTGN